MQLAALLRRSTAFTVLLLLLILIPQSALALDAVLVIPDFRGNSYSGSIGGTGSNVGSQVIAFENLAEREFILGGAGGGGSTLGQYGASVRIVKVSDDATIPLGERLATGNRIQTFEVRLVAGSGITTYEFFETTITRGQYDRKPGRAFRRSGLRTVRSADLLEHPERDRRMELPAETKPCSPAPASNVPPLHACEPSKRRPYRALRGRHDDGGARSRRSGGAPVPRRRADPSRRRSGRGPTGPDGHRGGRPGALCRGSDRSRRGRRLATRRGRDRFGGERRCGAAPAFASSVVFDRASHQRSLRASLSAAEARDLAANQGAIVAFAVRLVPEPGFAAAVLAGTLAIAASARRRNL